MTDIIFQQGKLAPEYQTQLDKGFRDHGLSTDAPLFSKQDFHWKITIQDRMVAALTANCLWDWLYVDELFVEPTFRKKGFGRRLMETAERYAKERDLSGIWLWTQSWQAESFYVELGYQEFTRFANFPKGHQRIGLRKEFKTSPQ